MPPFWKGERSSGIVVLAFPKVSFFIDNRGTMTEYFVFGWCVKWIVLHGIIMIVSFANGKSL